MSIEDTPPHVRTHPSGEWDASEECRSGLRRLEKAIRDVMEKIDALMEKRSAQATDIEVLKIRVATAEQQLKEQADDRRQLSGTVKAGIITALLLGIGSITLHYFDKTTEHEHVAREASAPALVAPPTAR